MMRLLIGVCGLGGAAAIAMLGAGYLGRFHPALDAFAHLRVYVAAALIVLALLLVVVGWFKLGVLGLVVAGLAIATTLPRTVVPGLGLAYGATTPADPDRPVYRLLQLNVRYDNPDKAQVLSLIAQTRPDIVTLDEVTDEWRSRLDALTAYPVRHFCLPQGNFWGVAILSRRPLAEGSEPRCNEYSDFAVASLDLNGRTLEVAAAHLGWPWPFEQPWNLRRLAPDLAGLGPTALLAGDMNAVPWSYAMTRLAAMGGLTLMPSAGATFLHYGLPRSWIAIGLPIDQVFAKGDVEVHAVTRLQDVASDHRPILVEFSLKPGSHDPAEPSSEVVRLTPDVRLQ